MTKTFILALAIPLYILVSWHIDEIIRSARLAMAGPKERSPFFDGEYHNHI